MKTPVIVSFTASGTPVWDIPFPAITVCPETKTRKDVFNYASSYEELNNSLTLDDDRKFFFNCLADICKTLDYDPLSIPLESFPKFNNASKFIEALLEMTPIFMETFDYCLWLNKFEDCKTMFQLVLTDEGLCYTFNTLSFEQIYRKDV